MFSDADTAVGKLLQFDKDGVTEFLKGGFSKFSGGLPKIDGLGFMAQFNLRDLRSRYKIQDRTNQKQFYKVTLRDNRIGHTKRNSFKASYFHAHFHCPHHHCL